MSTFPPEIASRQVVAAASTSGRRRRVTVARGLLDFARGFAAVMARPVGDPRTFSPRYFGERPLFLGGKAVVVRTRDGAKTQA